MTFTFLDFAVILWFTAEVADFMVFANGKLPKVGFQNIYHKTRIMDGPPQHGARQSC